MILFCLQWLDANRRCDYIIKQCLINMKSKKKLKKKISNEIRQFSIMISTIETMIKLLKF